MIVLGIDTSCDDTGAGVVVDGDCILSNVIASQHGYHRPFGGVVPSLAARRHSLVVNQIVDKAVNDAKISYRDIDLIAVSSDQGLGPVLAVGVAAAKTLAMILQRPFLGLHHVEGHIYSNMMAHKERLHFPFLCPTIAGGHTMILAVHALGRYELIGSSRDDSAGEAYDKIARRLGLGYPGGPVIDALAREGNPSAFNFPRPLLKGDEVDFSFSGLKTSVNRTIDMLELEGKVIPIADIAASFQSAVIDVLAHKISRAVLSTSIKQVAIAGGVAANKQLKARMDAVANEYDLEVFFPPHELCIDNGAMIAGVAFQKFMQGEQSSLDLDYRPNAPLGELQVKYRHKTKYRQYNT